MRLRMGVGMTILAGGVLFLDHHVERWLQMPFYPCLFLATGLLVVLATLELHHLLSELPRPPLGLCLLGTLCTSLACLPALFGWRGDPPQPWRDVAWVLAGILLTGFLVEMAHFRQPGGVVVRLSLLLWITAYLGVLTSFFLQLRFWPAETAPLTGVAAMILVIFVPKGGDIGAYFTGRALGRHRMTPTLSPKKTWEGLVGGLLLSSLVAVLVQQLIHPVFRSSLEAALFGLIVGGAGVLGDLAESLIKRDCQKKDASQVVPGFGGILDVVDSVLFAAPVAYWWLLGG